MRLTGYDYVLDNHDPCGGLERLSGCIAASRSEGIETILCDNGDFLEGNPLADIAMDLDDMGAHPLVKAMNALNYDAISLGNHEFDFGTAKLRQVIKALNAPVICANVRVSQQKHFTTPWVIVERDLMCSDGVKRPIRIGLIGFVTPLQVHWGRSHDEEPLTADDILAAAMTHLPALRRAGADIAVAMAHTGIGPISHRYGMENAAYPLAALRGIDALFLGHTHDQFPSEKFNQHEGIDCENGMILGTPTAMAGHLGEALGQIDLELEHVGDEWQITGHAVRIISADTSNLGPDPEFTKTLSAALSPLHERTQLILAEPLGQTQTDITTYFTSIGYDPTLKLVAQAKMDAIAVGLVGTPYESLPMVGTAASFHAGGRQGSTNYIHIETGDVTAKQVAAMSPFDNPVCAILRRGWQLREWLERLSLQFNVVSCTDEASKLINDDFPPYHFDTLFGLEYAFDISSPHFSEDALGTEGRGRVPVLKFGGSDVLDDDLFVVATSRYRALGGGCIGNVPKGDIVFETSQNTRHFITNRLRQNHEWDNNPNWRFANVSGAKTILDTNPKAAKLLPTDRIRPLNQYSNGFQSFEFTL